VGDTHVTIEWGDGYVSVYPDFPTKLTDQLKYWHRTFVRRGREMVSTGEYRELFVAEMKLFNGQYGKSLNTLPGFLFRIKHILKSEGYTFDLIDKRTPPPAVDLVKAMGGMREYQYPCVGVALTSGGGIIAVPTGWGKTHVMKAIINGYDPEELRARNTPLIVVTTPDKDVTLKDYEDLVELLPGRELGLVMSGHKQRFSDDVQVITLDSLHKLNPDDVGVLIVDEVHTAASERRTETILGFRKALRYGVSATPDGRFDGRDLVTEGLFGPVVYRRSYAQGIADGALVPIKVYWVRIPEPSIGLANYMAYKTRAGKYRIGVDRDATQSAIIGELMSRIPNDLQTLCIMRHVDQMNRLAPLCPNTRYVHAEENQAALAKRGFTEIAAIDKKERRLIYAAMRDGEIRKILSTYVYKQGVNFPELTVIINAGGGGSDIVAQQIPGRESRNIEGKHESYLVDFWHDWDRAKDKNDKLRPGPILSDDISREQCYTQLGFNQVWLDDINELPFLQAP
jgi:superfamily II DNA or RNA helicase